MTETPASPSRRQQCPRCLRPQAACICAFAAPLHTDVELLLLQHPMEVSEAKGSARLLHLSLPGSRLVVGETFDEATLRELLHAGGRVPVLLYPAEQGSIAFDSRGAAPASLRLVVIDGTWRKSRKMLHLNPVLRTLPRIALANAPPSSYRIRKAHAPHQLSTLEAAACAIAQLDPAADTGGLLAGFDAFVRARAAFAGR